MRSKSCLCKNLETTSAPNVYETPRSFSPQPMTSLSGSDQRRSQSNPWSGTSVGRWIRRICSMECKSGLRPPWQQKIFSSTIAATGKQLKQSVKVFQSLMLYRLLPVRERRKSRRGQKSPLIKSNRYRSSCFHSTMVRTLIIKTIDAVDGSTFMIPSKKEEVFWVLDFISQEQANGFQ